MKGKKDIAAVQEAASPVQDLDGMIGRITQDHHPAIRQNIAWLKQVFAKVVQIHDHEHPEIVPVYMQFLQMAEDLERHMVKEESVIFPYLVKTGNRAGRGLDPDPRGLGYRGGDNPLQAILWEHEATQQDWAELRRMTSGFRPPQGGCGFLEAVYWGLNRLEPILLVHLNLETQELYPRVKKNQWLQ